MGKPDDRAPRITREFDTGKLAVLTKQPLPDDQVQQRDDEQDDSAPIAIGRTETIDDPMTTGLLAEVARRSQTVDFDEESIKEVLTKMNSGETNHPHTLRRSR
jgi:hypothetical protein